MNPRVREIVLSAGEAERKFLWVLLRTPRDGYPTQLWQFVAWLWGGGGVPFVVSNSLSEQRNS